MKHAGLLCVVSCIWLNAYGVDAAEKGGVGQQQTPFFDYSQLRALFPPGYCSFPVKYGRAEVKAKGRGPTATDPRLRQEKYQFYLGPLGLKCLMHDKTFNRSGLHRSIFPPVLMDRNSNLAYSCFEVMHVLPGSPAKGKVRVGDIIIMVNGHLLKSGKEMFPEARYGFMRQLTQHMAELLDESEGTGSVELKILRPPEGETRRLSQDLTRVLHEFGGRKQDAEIPLRGLKSLILTNSDTDGKGYRGDTIWVNPRLTGPKGVLLVKDMDWISRTDRDSADVQVGEEYALREQYGADGNVMLLKANSEIVYAVPRRYDSFRVTVLSNHDTSRGRIETFVPLEWTPRLRGFERDVQVALPRFGEFAEGFPDNCTKSHLLAKSYVEFLLKYQHRDGSWNRWGGTWTSNGFDTAIVGLALLSMGDESLAPRIRKAAYLVAGQNDGGWATVEGTKILFLSEYFLRTRDRGILPHLQRFVDKAQDSLMGDYYVGHKYGNPGYNGRGMSVGFAYVLLALSVAAKTDANVDAETLDNMHGLCARLAAINGGIPYGRFWKPQAVPEVPWNAAARTGPALAAAVIHGGNRNFIEKAMGMYKATYGAVDKVHACPSMGFLGANLAFSVADRSFFRKSMAYYKWKFILNRSPHAGVLLNPQNMHRASGEGPLGKWWRMAATTILLNAGKRNMAITGKPQYLSRAFKTRSEPSSYDARLQCKYARDWTVAESMLGDACPAELRGAAARLRGMEIDANIRETLLRFLEGNASRVVGKVKALRAVGRRTQAYAIELLLGVDHIVKVKPKRGSQGGHWIDVTSSFPFGGMFARQGNADLDRYRNQTLMNMKGTITLLGSGVPGGKKVTLRIDTTSLEEPQQWHLGSLTSRLEVAWKSRETFTVPCRFEFNLGGIPVSYTRDLIVNNAKEVTGIPNIVANHRAVPVIGRLLRGGLSRVQSIRLTNGHRMDVLVPEGVDLLDPTTMGFPAERGDTVKVEYCANGLNPMYRKMRITKTRYTKRVPVSCRALSPARDMSEDLLRRAHDGDLKTNVQIKSRGAIVLEFTFSPPRSVSSVIGNYEGKSRAKELRAEGMHDGEWRDLGYLAENKIRTGKVRVTLSRMTFNNAVINEIHFSGKDQ